MAVADRTETYGELEYARAQLRMYMYLRVAGEARAPATRIRLGRASGVHGTYQKSSVRYGFSRRGALANRTEPLAPSAVTNVVRRYTYLAYVPLRGLTIWYGSLVRRFVVASVKCSEYY